MVGDSPPMVDPLLSGGPPAAKKKTGRPTKGEAAEKAIVEHETEKRLQHAAAELWADDIEPVVAWPFETVAERRGDHWKLSAKESRKLAVAIARVGVKHLPGFLDQYGEEFNLAVCVIVIFSTRIARERKLAQSSTRPHGDAAGRQDHAPASNPDTAA